MTKTETTSPQPASQRSHSISQATSRGPPTSAAPTSPSEKTDITTNSAENWPFSYRTDAKNSAVMLPPLSHVIGTHVREDATGLRSELATLLSKPYKSHPYSDSDLTNIEQKLPSSGMLEEFLDLFFQGWYNVVPTVHRPTWDHRTASPVLKAAMVSIGAGFSDRPDAHTFGDNLSELTKRAITWMISHDGNVLRNEDFMSAMLYQAIYSLGSGNKRLYETADSSRTTMVTNARAMGLFDVKPEDFSSWVEYERRKRIAWLMFEFDCTICTLTSSRPCISIHDLRLNLPCDVDVWQGRKPWKDGPSFTQTIANVLQGNVDPDLNWYSKRLISQTLGRSIWDYTELESNLAFKPLGLSEEPKLRLLQALNSIRGSRDASEYEAGHVTMVGMINCYSHMFNSHIMDHVTAATRMPTQQNVARVRRELERDPRQSRYLAWQASMIVAVVQNNPIYTPCESMRVFMAGLYLYWYSMSAASRGTGAVPAPDAGIAGLVRLDVLPWLADKAKHMEWANNGGVACIGDGPQAVKLHGVDGAVAILSSIVNVLKSLRPWGIAEKFSTVLYGLESATDRLFTMFSGSGGGHDNAAGANNASNPSQVPAVPMASAAHVTAPPPPPHAQPQAAIAYTGMPPPHISDVTARGVPAAVYSHMQPVPMTQPMVMADHHPTAAYVDQPRVVGIESGDSQTDRTPYHAAFGAQQRPTPPGALRPDGVPVFRNDSQSFTPVELQQFR